MSEKKISLMHFDTLISFIGVTENLVFEFFKPYITINYDTLKRIILFTKSFNSNEEDEIQRKSQTLLKNVELFLGKMFPQVEIKIIYMKNMWNLKDYYSTFKEIKSEKASINITAGPSVYSIAGLMWAIEHNHFVEHSVEAFNSVTGRSVVFNRIDVNPYFKSIYFTDNIDKVILKALDGAQLTTNYIRKYIINTIGDDLSLRTIQNRVNKLKEYGIVSISVGRQNTIQLSDEMKKII